MKSYLKHNWVEVVVGLAIIAILGLAVIKTQAQTNPGLVPGAVAPASENLPDDIAPAQETLKSVLPLVPPQYQKYVMAGFVLLVLAAKIGRFMTGYKAGGVSGGLQAVFAGSVTAMKLLLILGLAAFVLTGCTFARTTTKTTVSPTGTNIVTVERAQIWAGYIVEHSSTLLGVDAESPSGANNGTVKMKLGFGNDYTRYTPTSTNALFAPKYVTSLGIHQTMVSSQIAGESASGDTFYNTTNSSAGASVPGTPTPQQTK